MKFNTKVKFTNADKYIGQPLVFTTGEGSKYIFTVIKEDRPLPIGTIGAKYVTSTMYQWKNREFEDMSMFNLYVSTSFSKDTYCGMAELRTPTVDEYRMYKKLLRKFITFNKWK